jgi:hypothetical protein
MASKTVQPSLPAMNLQRTFENAVRDIHQAGLTGKISRQRTPIAQRMLNAPAASPDNARKQALSDAAKALAQLWKVVPSSSR